MRLRGSCCALIALAAVAIVGCGEVERKSVAVPASTTEGVVYQTRSAVPSDAHSALANRFAYFRDSRTNEAADEPRAVPAGEAAGNDVPAAVDRKIIYTAHIDVVVESFDGVPERVADMVRDCGGYVAESNLDGKAGKNRHASWRIRVPVARFDEFIGTAKGVGELKRAATESQDVTEQYVDVEARIRNKTREEERLLMLLETRPGKLEDVVAIERELSRVREELERMQGRLRVLSNLTALTTVNLAVEEIRGYEPPATASLATRVRRAFVGSIENVQSAGAATLVGIAAFVPVAVVFFACAIPFVALVRYSRKRRMY